MSVNETLVSRKVQLSVADGTTASGTAKLKTRSFNGINPDATADDMHAVGVALASLMSNQLANLYYDDKKQLTETDEGSH